MYVVEKIFDFRLFIIFSGRTFNLVDTLWTLTLKILSPFLNNSEKQRQNIKGKLEFIRLTNFQPTQFTYLVKIQKLITVYRYLKFSPILTFSTYTP